MRQGCCSGCQRTALRLHTLRQLLRCSALSKVSASCSFPPRSWPHSERIAAERAAAEASGAAQLQRLQEQVLQTRVKYNRAKYQVRQRGRGR